MIILIGGEKGGTGKTTIATNLAQIHACAGNDTLLLDMDKQGSCSEWMEQRSEHERESPQCVALHSKSKQGSSSGQVIKYLLTELKKLKSKYETIIIDSGGRDSIEFRAALTIADVMYSPIRTSQFDVNTLETLDELVSVATIQNPELKAHVFINCASTNARSSFKADVQKLLKQDYYENLKPAQTVIHERAVFAHAATAGLGICELRNEKAQREIMSLYKEILNGNS